MVAAEDALGTVRGHYARDGEPEGANRVPRLLIGSHIDTVLNAGKYDGMLGVVAGILAVEHFRDQNQRFPFAVDVLAFGDEEGSRFPTVLSSSAATAGAFDTAWLKGVDRDGISLEKAMAGLRARHGSGRHRSADAGRGARLCRGPYRAGAGAGAWRPAARRGHLDCRAEPHPG